MRRSPNCTGETLRQARFWLVWSLRDLRRRWAQVLATALVIAIGIAVFAGLGGMRQFREESARRSFDALKFHDLRVSLPDGVFASAGQLDRAVRKVIGTAGVQATAAQERLLVSTQIDAGPIGRDVLTPGLVIGVPLGDDRRRDDSVTGRADGSAGGSRSGTVDLVHASRGRALAPRDDGRNVAVLDDSYAHFYKLPISGRLALPGGESIEYVGQGQSPQYFLITSETGFGGESTLGVLYTSLKTAQRLSGRTGAINELELRLAPSTATIRGAGSGAGTTTDPAAGVAAAKRAIENSEDPLLAGVEVTRGVDEQSYTIMFRDAENDQRMLGFFGLLVLLGASVAAFNLVGRAVEAERREIGIGMALGVPTPRLALRPLLLGAEIALAGTVLGAALSIWLAGAYAGVFKEFLPLPVWGDTFDADVFVRGGLVGFVLPFAASAWPVWRAVRVQPVQAIRVSARAASGGFVRAATHLRLPGDTVAQMPWRNSSRTPRRTLLAVIGLAAVLGAIVSLVGVMDSFTHTVQLSRAEIVGRAPGRLNAALEGLKREDDPAVRALSRTKGVAKSDPRLDLPGAISAPGSESIFALLSINQTNDAAASPPVWLPTIDAGRLPRAANEIAIAPKAASDLKVEVGDHVDVSVAGPGAGGKTVEHRLRLKVSGLTADPFRAFAYATPDLASRLGLGGLTNAVSVMPRPGASEGAVRRALATGGIVATTRAATADTDALTDTIDQFQGVLRVAAIAALVLAVLMAFNLAGISLEERRREYATMFAYGLSVRRALGVAAVENLIVGVLGTALGLLIGVITTGWILTSLTGETWPEIGMIRHLSLGSAAGVVFVGIAAVSITPYLMVRRLTGMDVPSTLRVVE